MPSAPARRTPLEEADLYDRLALEDGDADSGYYRHAAPDFRLRTISRAINGLCPARVLDVGCGDGVTLERAVALAAESRVGLDLSLVSLQRLKARRAGLAVKGDGGKLPFRDSIFDAVLLNQVLEHVAEPAALLEEAERVAAAEGTVLITVPMADWFRLCKGIFGGRIGFLDAETHYREWSLLPFRGFEDVGRLLGMVRDSGFRVRRIRGIFHYTWRLEKAVDALFRERSEWHPLLFALDRLMGALPLGRFLGKYLLITAIKQ